MTFGKILRSERIRAGRSMGAVARHLGVSVVYVSNVENEKRAPLTNDRILAVAQLFGIGPDPLLVAAATCRGTFELEARRVSPKARRVGAALMRRWLDLDEADLDRIAEILNRREFERSLIDSHGLMAPAHRTSCSPLGRAAM